MQIGCTKNEKYWGKVSEWKEQREKGEFSVDINNDDVSSEDAEDEHASMQEALVYSSEKIRKIIKYFHASIFFNLKSAKTLE